jgi:D-alanyl-D-alanine carboxypeptidase
MTINKWITILGASILVMQLSGCSDSAKADPSSGEQMANHAAVSEESSDQPIQDLTMIALVNKQNSLDETYVPPDLVTVDVPTALNNPEVNQLRKAAADALKEMFEKAKASGIKLVARSGYRSYQTQVQLFNNYSNKHGEEAANRYSAKAGQSEHQTGLVMDVTSDSVNLQLEERFGETVEGIWLSEHAHEFGFIIRYPKDMESITGYIYEPWHIRYVGVAAAAEIFNSGQILEEYLWTRLTADE